MQEPMQGTFVPPAYLPCVPGQAAPALLGCRMVLVVWDSWTFTNFFQHSVLGTRSPLLGTNAKGTCCWGTGWLEGLR